MNTDNKNNTANNSEETPIYLTSDSTLQTAQEHQHDQSVDPRKDTTMEVSNDDLNETETDRRRNEMLGSENSDGNEAGS